MLCEQTPLGPSNPQHKLTRNATWTWFSYSEECGDNGNFIQKSPWRSGTRSREERIGWVFRRHDTPGILYSKIWWVSQVCLYLCVSETGKQAIATTQPPVPSLAVWVAKRVWVERVRTRMHTHTHCTVYTLPEDVSVFPKAYAVPLACQQIILNSQPNHNFLFA